MPNFRQRIRTSLAARLANTTHIATPVRQQTKRVLPVELCPAVATWIESDNVSNEVVGLDTHELELLVECFAIRQDPLSAVDVAEEMLDSVESLLSPSPIEGVEFDLESITFTEEHEGQTPIVIASIRYELTYQAEPGLDAPVPAGG